jgi:hypothetical protein
MLLPSGETVSAVKQYFIVHAENHIFSSSERTIHETQVSEPLNRMSNSVDTKKPPFQRRFFCASDFSSCDLSFQSAPTYSEDQGQFWELWPSSRHLSPKIRVFVDFAAEHLFAIPSVDSPDATRS